MLCPRPEARARRLERTAAGNGRTRNVLSRWEMFADSGAPVKSRGAPFCFPEAVGGHMCLCGYALRGASVGIHTALLEILRFPRENC